MQLMQCHESVPENGIVGSVQFRCGQPGRYMRTTGMTLRTTGPAYMRTTGRATGMTYAYNGTLEQPTRNDTGENDIYLRTTGTPKANDLFRRHHVAVVAKGVLPRDDCHRKYLATIMRTLSGANELFQCQLDLVG